MPRAARWIWRARSLMLGPTADPLNPDYSKPSPRGCRPWSSSLWVGAPRLGSPLWALRPLTPHGEGTATGCPTGQPEGWGAGIGRGMRTRSHTRRYQPRCGQLDDSRTTIRRVLTTTSAATLMSRVRQVQG